jgi:hypothetical protein
MKINWECFFDNSSTTEALIYFAYTKYSFKTFSQDCWPNECKMYIKMMSRIGYKKSRARAQKALVSRGYLKKEFDFCSC